MKLVAKLALLQKIEKVFAVGVRCGDDVRNSIRDRGFRHGDRFFDGGGALIKTRQNVTGQIDPSNQPSLVPPGTQSPQPAEGQKNSPKNLAPQRRPYPIWHLSSPD